MNNIISDAQGNEITSSILQNIDLPRILLTIGIIGVAVFINRFVKRMYANWIKSHPGDQSAFLRSTVGNVVVRGIKAVFVVMVAGLVLDLYGVDLGGIFAGIGILSAVIGLAMQDYLKDIIMGIRILTEGIFHVGDIVEYKGMRSKVMGFGLTSTELYIIPNDGTLYLANRLIGEITRFEPTVHRAYLDIPFSYKDDPAAIGKLLTDLLPEIDALPGCSDAQFSGIWSFELRYTTYRVSFLCPPEVEIARSQTVNFMVRSAAHKAGLLAPAD
ncbi:MAG: mechanosensitive ion channel family protein [Clostridia bacterium]|nr:mechanosensitive ion channel family protein [Clostridia bacterium]